MSYWPYQYIILVVSATACTSNSQLTDDSGLGVAIFLGMYTGAEIILQAQFDIEKFCAAIQEFKITFTFVVSVFSSSFIFPARLLLSSVYVENS